MFRKRNVVSRRPKIVRRNFSGDPTGEIGGVINTIRNIATNSSFIVIVLAGYYLSNHTDNIKNFADKFTKVTIVKPIATYVSNHTAQTALAIPLWGAALLAPMRYQAITFGAMSFFAYEVFTPKTEYLEAVLCSGLALTFMRVRTMYKRVLVVGLFGALLWHGHLPTFVAAEQAPDLLPWGFRLTN